MMRGTLLLCFLLLPLQGAWVDDLNQARARAAKEQKDLFLVFTSLDVSGACVQLEKRVLSQEAFHDVLDDRFILVHLDVPMKRKVGMVPANAGNLGIAREFGVEVYPSSLWLDANGLAYAREGGALPGGPAEVALKVLEKQRLESQRNQSLKVAYREQGMKRAEALVAALKKSQPGSDPSRDGEHLKELARLDPADTLAFQGSRKARIAFQKLDKDLQDKFKEGSYQEAIVQVNQYLTEHRPDIQLHQKILFRKLAALRQTGRTEDAVTTAETIVQLDHKSSHGRLAAQILEGLKQR